MVSSEREPITRFWRQDPHGVQGRAPGQEPQETESFFTFAQPE